GGSLTYESTQPAISRNCARKPIRSRVTRFTVGTASRFSASSTRLISVITQPLAMIASAHHVAAREVPNDIALMPPRRKSSIGVRLRNRTKITRNPAAPKTIPEVARDFASVDRNRKAAEVHI